MRIFCLLLTLLVLIPVVSALPVADNTTPMKHPANGPTDPAEVEAFLDTVMPANLARYNVPGATVAVVANGKLILAKGYGYSDLANRTPVDAETTTFRVGSITKLFTWTAVMQLVDEGKIDLNADVNTYLKDFRIPDTYPGHPVTMHSLMTHTAGFEDNGIHQTVDSEGDLYPFRGYCAENLPARVYPPGTVTSYSNYGTTLAAVIVEDVSGVPYEQYVRSRILAPLAMNLTTVPETLPPDAAARLSKGYTLTGRENLPLPDSIYVIGPAGTIMSTAPDMAKFMLAGLGNGTYGNATILPERAAALMHARAFANDPRVSGMCLGFYEQYYNGLRTTGHGGDTEEFHSQLVLIPDKQAGYFVSYNSRGGGAARDELFEDFMDHYYPAESPVLPEPGPANVSRLQQYAGTYESNRHSYTRFEKYVNPNSRQEITVTPNGTLMTGSREYVETGPGVFSRLDGTRPALGDLVFHAAPDGTIEYYCLVNLPVFVFDRVPWYATQGFTDGLKTAAGILLATVFLWPLLFAFRRSHGIPEPASLTVAVIARWIAGAAALVLTAFVFVVLPAVVADESLMQSYFHERTVPALLTAVLSIPVIAAVLTAATVALAAFAWKQKFWTLPHRIQYTVVAVALVAMLWWVNFWNLWVWCL